MLTYGVIGTGQWGTKVIKAIRALGYDVRVCNRSGEYEDQAVCRDYKTLIPNVDIVWVATHPSTNCEIAAYAIEHGKPTVVEKPVAFTSQQVAALVRASKAKQVPLIVDYIWLFQQEVVGFQPHVGSHIEVVLGNNGPVRDYSALWDYGSHAIAVVLDSVNLPISKLQVRVRNPKNTKYEVEFQFNEIGAVVVVSNMFPCRRADFQMGENQFSDRHEYAPLQTLIGKIARLHLRNEYWSNGDLAVEVTDVLERLHKLLPQA